MTKTFIETIRDDHIEASKDHLRAVDARSDIPKVAKPPRPEPKSYRIENTLQGEREFLAIYKGVQVSVKWEGEDEAPDLDESDFVDDDGEFDAEGWSDFEWKRDGIDAGPEDGQAWYIIVGPIGTLIGSHYEGWWGNADDTLEAAVEQALIGSMLITEAQRKFKVAA